MATSKPIASMDKVGERSISLVIPVPPVPASRPRVTRWKGVYYGKRYSQWIAGAEAALAPLSDKFKFSGYCRVDADIIVAPLKTVKRSVPRGDVDNFIKGPLDAITKAGILWDDDDQVQELYISKRFAGAEEVPRTQLLITEYQ